MEILDCTLRDGGNVVGAGFSAEMTRLILEGLIESGIKTIEYGHPSGLGGNVKGVKVSDVSDCEYLEVGKPFFAKGEVGMFAQPQYTSEHDVERASEAGIGFLRVGTNAGDAITAEKLVRKISDCGIKPRFSLMKAYILSPEKLADEAKRVESYGAQSITMMDSAGYMFPGQVAEYTEKLQDAVKIPVGIHSHNNLGLCVANAVAAIENGAQSVDAGLMGMARSVGNIPTEVIAAVLSRMGQAGDINLYGLLDFIDNKLAPRMDEKGYKAPISTIELILGYCGCHSSFLKIFEEVAVDKNVNLYRLIVETSKKDRKAPCRELIEQVAEYL